MNDLPKEYLIQCIKAASNNLRIGQDKIETLSIIKHLIINSKNIEEDLIKWKSIPEAAGLANRLNELYYFISRGNVDFGKLSDTFRAHSHYLVKDLGFFLDKITSSELTKRIADLENGLISIANVSEETRTEKKEIKNKASDLKLNEGLDTEKIVEEEKERIILNVENENESFFDLFEREIISSIKTFNALLDKLSLQEKVKKEEFETLIKIAYRNAKQAQTLGFELIANMHRIFAKSLALTYEGKLQLDKQILSSMRACLIVIAAVIRSKEVDIKQYLQKAEELGKKINMLI